MQVDPQENGSWTPTEEVQIESDLQVDPQEKGSWTPTEEVQIGFDRLVG
ncbi:MAG: hypothetical protein GY696_30825 [Gammaproteobacteria bacterium]|nr:hypothetical protein [Gammaproteobacteria bacterium]